MGLSAHVLCFVMTSPVCLLHINTEDRDSMFLWNHVFYLQWNRIIHLFNLYKFNHTCSLPPKKNQKMKILSSTGESACYATHKSKGTMKPNSASLLLCLNIGIFRTIVPQKTQLSYFI
jgi:hypothetical protein